MDDSIWLGHTFGETTVSGPPVSWNLDYLRNLEIQIFFHFFHTKLTHPKTFPIQFLVKTSLGNVQVVCPLPTLMKKTLVELN